MNERFFFSSHSLEILASELLSHLSADAIGLFSRALVVIPHKSVKEWLQMAFCRHGNSANMGIEFVSWETLLVHLVGPIPVPSRSELFAAIWQEIGKPFASEKQKLDLVEHLASLFCEYICSGFPQTIPEEASWQKTLFEKILQSHSWQNLPDALKGAKPRDLGPLYLFGIDYLPTAVHRFLLEYPKLKIFRFSPTAMFWEDLRASDSELRLIQPLLANWGSLGRKMLADTGNVLAEEDENYDLEPQELTNLQRLKLDLLLLEKQVFAPVDFSLRCLQTGTSRLQEVQILHREIARLAVDGVPLSEIRVYAPDIAPYAPLLEFCFSESIPLRISGVDLSRQSSFYQAIECLFLSVEGRWEADEIFTLFELGAFYKQAKWQREEVKRFREWVRKAKIRWGLDGLHKEKRAEAEGLCQEMGTWKKGFTSLLDSWIFLQPEKEEMMSWLEVDLFQNFHQVFETLSKTLLSWKDDRTLVQWAEEIEKFIYSILFLDESCEMDRAAGRTFSLFLDLLRKVAKKFPETKFPFAFVQTYFATFSSGEEGGSLLHAVRCSSLEPGAILPARVLFILGVDEENFPRSSPISSLRLAVPPLSVSETDRYFLLQAIFAAKERLIFSYSHRSKDDGKTVNPSLLVQELFDYLGASDGFETPQQAPFSIKASSLLLNTEKLPETITIPTVISIQELTRFFKNPFQQYLRSLGIVLEEEPDSPWEEFELSSLSRYWLLRESLYPDRTEIDLPRGIFGDAAKLHVERARNEFRESLSEWKIEVSTIETLLFKETETPLELAVEGKTILLVGEASLAVPTGVLHMGSDEIGSILRKWPELLCALIGTQTNRIYCLKTGRIREVSNPTGALQLVVELYLLCQKWPFFLHPEWADDVLRKNRTPEESNDRVVSWMLKRSPDFSLHAETRLWQEKLADVFSPLTALFERRSDATV